MQDAMRGALDWLGLVVRLIVGASVAAWAGAEPLLQLLLILMVADVISGVVAGYIARELSSDVSLPGLMKKVLILVAVAVSYSLAATVPREAGGALIPSLVLGFFLAHEGLSFVENLGRAGVPIPPALRDALAKLDGSKGV